jgi:hypothetical protein
MKALFTILASMAVGLVIWRIDSQPHWDDTGITAAMILASTGLISFVNPKRPYICAIATCFWIPLFGIINHGNYGTLLVFIIGLVGAYGGLILRNAFQSAS